MVAGSFWGSKLQKIATKSGLPDTAEKKSITFAVRFQLPGWRNW